MGLDPVGVFTYRDGIAVIQLVFFLPYLALGILLCSRHGWRRSEGWIIMVTFSILRILAACFQLASITHPSTVTCGGALICQGIGLAPLVLLNLGLFFRVNKWLHLINDRIFTLISLVMIAGIVLAIYGGSESADSATLATNAFLKASVILFVAGYIAFAGIFMMCLREWKVLPKGEQRLLLCFAASAPFMVVRCLFSILGDYVRSLRGEFGVLTGNVTAFLCMSVLEEIIVVAFFVLAGMSLDRLPPEMKTGARPIEVNDSELASREEQ